MRGQVEARASGGESLVDNRQASSPYYIHLNATKSLTEPLRAGSSLGDDRQPPSPTLNHHSTPAATASASESNLPRVEDRGDDPQASECHSANESTEARTARELPVHLHHQHQAAHAQASKDVEGAGQAMGGGGGLPAHPHPHAPPQTHAHTHTHTHTGTDTHTRHEVCVLDKCPSCGSVVRVSV